MELFSYFRSSAAYRVRIALNLKAVDYKLEPVNLVQRAQRSDDYLAVNPQGLVPSLKLDDGRIITQSVAILEWLEATHPEPALLPADPYAAAQVRATVNAIACDIHPVNNLRVLKYLTGALRVSDEDKTAWYHHWIALGFSAIEQQITAAPYCYGDQITLADICLVPQVFNANRFKVDLGPYPKIVSVAEACNRLDAFAKAHPDRQPDNPEAGK